MAYYLFTPKMGETGTFSVVLPPKIQFEFKKIVLFTSEIKSGLIRFDSTPIRTVRTSLPLCGRIPCETLTNENICPVPTEQHGKQKNNATGF